METISWEAPEFEHHERGVLWYLGMFLTATVLVLFALWQKNFLFAIFLVIAIVLLFVWSKRRPNVHQCSITETYLVIGRFPAHPLETFSGFIIAETRQDNPSWGTLLLRSAHRLRPQLSVLVPRGKLQQVAERLLRQLPQLHYEESATDALIRLFKL